MVYYMKANIISLEKSYFSPCVDLNEINLTIDKLINNEFDIYHNCATGDRIDLPSIITKTLIGSKKIRFGNYPSDSNINFIKDLISKQIAKNEPIALVVPMGPHKTILNENVDLAEVYALKTLSALNERVKQFYPQGLHIYLREEDITGWFLTGTTREVQQNIESYLLAFEKLIRVLKYDNFISTFRESHLVNYVDILALIKVYLEPMRNYINDSDDDCVDYRNLTSYKVLKALGWKGDIPQKQRNFYKERYKRNYPNKTQDEINEMMVNYLAISFAKSQFNALVPEHIKHTFIQLTFAPPIPGIPQDIVSRRIYYRTLPSSISRSHLPFWRAKGFLKVTIDGVNLALNNWDNQDEFYRHIVQLSSQNDTVILNADIEIH